MKTKHLFLTLGGALLLAAMPLHAQTKTFTRIEGSRYYAATTVDARDIQQSGAKDLNRLLEIYVPNMELILHHGHAPHLGNRGIISDRDDKYLFQVNGVTMNNRMLTGADNERGIPLLGDIESIDVLRGSAPVTYGPGALAGAIDLHTYNGLTFQGADVNLRQGVVDQYTALEVRLGKKLGADSGAFLYYGLADQPGADSDYHLGHSYPATTNLPANVAGQPFPSDTPNLWSSGPDELRHKLHVSYINGPLELWGRLVQDGYENRLQREFYSVTNVVPLDGRRFLNTEYTAAADFKQDLDEHWRLESRASYHRWEFRDQRDGRSTDPIRNATEDIAGLHALLAWSPVEWHSLSFGADYEHQWFHDPAQSDALDRSPVVTQRKWESDLVSLFAEAQLKLGNLWTLVLSAREDKHTFSDWMLSPRGTLVFAPTENDTFKFSGGETLRRNCDEELWAQYERTASRPNPESLRSYEISYDRKLGQNWHLGVNTYYQDYNAIGAVNPSGITVSGSVGEYKTLGGELQLAYVTAQTRFQISQGITRLLASSTTLPAGKYSGIAAPPGVSDDLAAWSTFITKASVTHDLTEKWTASSSLVCYWGYPGAQDLANYINAGNPQASNAPYTDPGYNDPFGASLFWNVGIEYRPTKHLTVRLDGYNLAALFDDTLSKRNYYFRTSEFSVDPASMGISIRYTF